jgi:ABC-type nickel/cobalt efflux system permease component RcnA
MLSSPLDVRDARVTFVPGSSGSEVVDRGPGGTLDRGTDAFAELASAKTLTPTAILVGLVTALVLGAFHALSPGHGKTVVAAYLVGSQGTARHAMFLGATVTATHTAGVYALGAVTLFLSEYVLPERLYPVLGVISGLSVVAMGGWLLAGRLRGVLAHQGAGSGDTHGHGQVHRHGGVAHSHVPPGTDGSPVTWRSLLTLGVTGGLLPCPSALVVLLSAIALHRVGFGLLLIVAFSLGLASVLVAIGLVLVYARGVLERFSVGGSVATRLLPVVSAFLILVAGAVITAQALPGLL